MCWGSHPLFRTNFPSFFLNPSPSRKITWHTLDVRRILETFCLCTKQSKMSISAISRFLKTCIAEAYKIHKLDILHRITVHSVRNVAADKAFANQSTVEEVCRVATWSSNSVHTCCKISAYTLAKVAFRRRVFQHILDTGDHNPLWKWRYCFGRYNQDVLHNGLAR